MESFVAHYSELSAKTMRGVFSRNFEADDLEHAIEQADDATENGEVLLDVSHLDHRDFRTEGNIIFTLTHNRKRR